MRLKILLIIFITAILGASWYFVIHYWKVNVLKVDVRKVQFLTKQTTQPIKNTQIDIGYGTPGLVCVAAPCPDQFNLLWTGVTDDNGFLFIPTKIITNKKYNKNFTVFSREYYGALITGYEELVELTPVIKPDPLRKIKIIDAESQAPIANTKTWATDSKNCRPPKCAGYFNGTTDSDGNIFVDNNRVRLSWQEDWFYVDGYQSIGFKHGPSDTIKVFPLEMGQELIQCIDELKKENDKYNSGQISVSFNKGTSGSEAIKIIFFYGLNLKKPLLDVNNVVIEVPVGEEIKWVCALKKEKNISSSKYDKINTNE